MKIGEEVYIHGFIDEIRKDTIIIRNEGGYFGTVKEEVESGTPAEWEMFKDDADETKYKCSFCEELALDDGNEPYLSRYCPFCGKFMKNNTEG